MSTIEWLLMPVQYSSHLYIRVERSLRADLSQAAKAAGLNVSAFARRELRAALDARPHARAKASPGNEAASQ